MWLAICTPSPELRKIQLAPDLSPSRPNFCVSPEVSKYSNEKISTAKKRIINYEIKPRRRSGHDMSHGK